MGQISLFPVTFFSFSFKLNVRREIRKPTFSLLSQFLYYIDAAVDGGGGRAVAIVVMVVHVELLMVLLVVAVMVVMVVVVNANQL